MWLKCAIVPLLIGQLVLAEIPGCDYFDTVDLTDSERLANGSYIYENIVIPPELTGEYGYGILDNGERFPVPTHLRGCACVLGACIRFCCHPNLELVDNERRCEGDSRDEVDFDPYLNITEDDGTVVLRHALEDFIVQKDLPVPCSPHVSLDQNEPQAQWTLFANGTFFRHFDSKYLSKQHYCLQPTYKEENDSTGYVLLPHNCNPPTPISWTLNTLRVLSILALIATIGVYLWMPKLRNLHGCCLVSYMFSLMIGYALIFADTLRFDLSLAACQLNGYIGYYFVMASFLWLTVISFNLWNGFRGNNYVVHREPSMSRLIPYSIYAWGVAGILTVTIFTLDHLLDPAKKDQVGWMPGVALFNCWVKTHDWSALLYFHGLMALQILFNIVMFVLTAIRIVEVQRELKSVALRGDHEQHLNSQKRTYALFVRLFVIMGVAWTFEIIGYLVQSNKVLEAIFLIFDYINSAQGMIIFAMFVLKRSVFKLISNRIRGIDDEASDSEEEIALQERNRVPKIGPSILN